MTYVYVAAVFVLLISLFHVVAGWIFSNGIRREVLQVGPRPQDLGIWVRSVTKERIDLQSKVPRQDIGHPGTFGLRWAGGYARVGDVIAADYGRIVRRFQPLDQGEPPPCRGDLDDCEPVELDSFVYPNDPGDVGLDFSDIEYESPLGPIGAWLVPGDSDGAWAIHCHGWTAERREHIRMLPTFHDRGRTSLVIDYRNDPGAPRDPTGLYRFGLSEWRDVEGALRHALEHGATDIVLTGCSTGAALVMAFLENSRLTEPVTGVVFDAPNLILAETFRYRLRDVRGSRLVKEMGLWLVGLRWGIDWVATNHVQRAEKTLSVPALVFHGTSDLTVPISTSRQLAAGLPELVDLVETPAAGHVLSWNANPDRYERYLSRFLESL